jgi:hypothetical protein
MTLPPETVIVTDPLTPVAVVIIGQLHTPLEGHGQLPDVSVAVKVPVVV